MRFVYILLCSDDSLYTGITTNIEERIEKHNQGKWAKYTSGRTPVRILYSQEIGNRSEASKEERRIKKLSRKQKLEIIENTI